jgi:hypothetical protein
MRTVQPEQLVPLKLWPEQASDIWSLLSWMKEAERERQFLLQLMQNLGYAAPPTPPLIELWILLCISFWALIIFKLTQIVCLQINKLYPKSYLGNLKTENLHLLG